MDNFRHVDDCTFEEYWKRERVQRIINYFRRKFSWLPRQRLTQAARIALWQALRRYEEAPANKKPAAFYTFFRHQCNGYFLKEGFDKHEKPKVPSAKKLSSVALIDDREIVNCLLSLNRTDRILFEDRYVSKMTHAEIAKKHGVTTTKISEALKRIKKKLEDGEKHE